MMNRRGRGKRCMIKKIDIIRPCGRREEMKIID
jgi:hypothetical protein